MHKVSIAMILALCGALFNMLSTELHANTANSAEEVLAASSEQQAIPTDVLNADTIEAGVNLERTKRGLQSVKIDPRLTAIAEVRAYDMKQRGYYAHKNPDGLYYSDLIIQAGIKHAYSCENLDINYGTNYMMYINDWLNSRAGHRECMLNGSVGSAGYAVISLEGEGLKQGLQNAYIVVAIHATD
jgi:uncharacterized protein YkwD